MHDTEFKVVEKWTKYDERGFPVFHLEWLTYEEFSQLAKDAVDFFLDQSQEITEETIDKIINEMIRDSKLNLASLG